MTQPWPLFELRIRTPRLELRLPTDGELTALAALARAGIHPSEEMPFGIPWTDAAGVALERAFLQYHWRTRGEWRPDAWRLELGVLAEGQPVGIQAVGAAEFAVLKTVTTGSWLGRAFQGRGIGKEMRAAVLALAFDHLDAEFATSASFADNPASAEVSRALGYEENGRDHLAPRGVAKELVRFRMTRDQWRSRPRPVVEVVGLDQSLELFGASD